MSVIFVFLNFSPVHVVGVRHREIPVAGRVEVADLIERVLGFLLDLHGLDGVLVELLVIVDLPYANLGDL